MFALIINLVLADDVIIRRNAINIFSNVSDTAMLNGEPDMFNLGKTTNANFHTGFFNINDIGRMLIKFNISGNIPIGATINKAVINLTIGSCNGSAFLLGTPNYELFRMQEEWYEGIENFVSPTVVNGTTWNDREHILGIDWGSASGGAFGVGSTNISPSATALGNPYTPVNKTIVTFDSDFNNSLLTDVQNWLNDPDVNYGYLLKEFEDTDGRRASFFASECLNAVGFTEIQFLPLMFVDFTPDLLNPNFNTASINNSAPKLNDVTGLSQEVADNSGLNSYMFTHNQSGTFINESAVSISGISANATFDLTITLTRGEVIGYQWWVDDLAGNSNTTAIASFTVGNTAPETPTIINPNSSLTNRQPLPMEVTFPEDADSDQLTIFYYINGTLNQTSLTNTTFNASDGNYTLEVSVSDGVDSSPNASISFSIDTTNPILTVNAPSDASQHGFNIAVDIVCVDPNIFLLNYTLSNGSGILISEQDNTITGSQLSISSTIEIANLTNGNYEFNTSCSDTHTKKDIGDYKPYKDYGNLKLSYTIAENNNDVIDIKLKTSDATLDDFGTYKMDDRYALWFDFMEEEDGTVYTYKFKIGNKESITYLPDSKYNGHFVTNYNWIDFEFDENEDAIYTVKELDDDKYEITIQTKKTYLHFRSIGGLNIVTDERTITIDKTLAEPQTTQLLTGFLTGALVIGIIIALIVGSINEFRKRKRK